MWRWLRGRLSVIGFLILVAGNVAGWRALEAETRARERESCESALETRDQQEAMWAELLARAGVRREHIDLLHDGYAELPTPASCDKEEPKP